MKVAIQIGYNDAFDAEDVDKLVRASKLDITQLVLHSGAAYDPFRVWAATNNIESINISPEPAPEEFTGSAKNLFENSSETRVWLTILSQSEALLVIGRTESHHYVVPVSKEMKVPLTQVIFKTVTKVAETEVK